MHSSPRIPQPRGHHHIYDAEWGTRFRGEGIFAEQIERMFEVARRRAGFKDDIAELSTAAFRRPGGTQLSLFA